MDTEETKQAATLLIANIDRDNVAKNNTHQDYHGYGMYHVHVVKYNRSM